MLYWTKKILYGSKYKKNRNKIIINKINKLQQSNIRVLSFSMKVENVDKKEIVL